MSNSKLSHGVFHKIPFDMSTAINKKRKAVNTWNDITPIARNEFICWVENVKQEITRTKRIKRTVDELLEGKRRPCCWVGCIHRTDKKPGAWQQDVLIDRKIKKKK